MIRQPHRDARRLRGANRLSMTELVKGAAAIGKRPTSSQHAEHRGRRHTPQFLRLAAAAEVSVRRRPFQQAGLLEQGKLARILPATRHAVHGEGRVLEGFGLFGQSFEVAACKGHERGGEGFGAEGTEEGTHTADIVAHSHDRSPIKRGLIFSLGATLGTIPFLHFAFILSTKSLYFSRELIF